MRHYLDSIGLWVYVCGGITLIVLTDMEEPDLKVVVTIAGFEP